MIQLFRRPHSGASTCCVFSRNYYYEANYVCSRCFQNGKFFRRLSDSSLFRSAVDKKIVKIKRNGGVGKKMKETELLKVTKTHTTQTRMKIGKLTASHVAAFAGEPGMIFKNVKREKSEKDFKKHSVNADFQTPLKDQDVGINCDVVDGTLKEQNVQENFKENSQQKHLEDKEKTFSKILATWVKKSGNESDLCVLAYIDVCTACGLLDYAFKLVNNSRYSIQNPEVYNVILRRLASIGDLDRADILVSRMDRLGVCRSPQTFALHLLCVPLDDDAYKSETILRNLQSEGYVINDLFTKTYLTLDEREDVLKRIRTVEPYFDMASSTSYLNSNCSLLANLYKDQQYLTSPMALSRDFISTAVEEQLSLENDEICTIQKIGGNVKFSEDHRLIWLKLCEKWERNFVKDFEASLKILQRKFNSTMSTSHLYPFFITLPPEAFGKIAAQEIHKIVCFSQSYSVSACVLYANLGRKVYQMFCKNQKTKNEEFNRKVKRYIEIYCNWYCNPVGPARNARQRWQMLMGDNINSPFLNKEHVEWPYTIEKNVGKFLYNIIFKSAMVPAELTRNGSDIPAFYLVLRQKKDKLDEEIKIHPVVQNIYERANINTLTFPAYELPMLCPPKPWSSPECGGYYFLSTNFVRTVEGSYKLNYLKSVPNQNLFAVFDAVNALQCIPWKINEQILDIGIKVFKEGGSTELGIPVKPDDMPPSKISPDLDYPSKINALKLRSNLLKQRAEQYSLWCEGLYKLSLANHFRNRIFWLPQNIDFRGRVYPVPPHISHVSADLYRSLLIFAKKERLGKKGLDWLKIHAINLTGAHKQKNIQERLNFANEILPDIIDSAENPLGGKRWWAKSDYPWQTLATCMEIHKALQCDDPALYESGFPVHQDGSCNGLQHYAALGRDEIGAVSVNLKPADSPQDVYTDVAKLIEIERAKDEEAGVEIAKMLKGFLSRKVVKRPVMTTVYGVTWYGAKEQISGVLQDMPEFPKYLIEPASTYIATKIFSSLRKLFKSARNIQDWFDTCSRHISKSCGKSVCWENPMGLPIVQPYFKKNKKLNLVLPNSNKQKNAFAPNFIHSLDSSHMMMTALHCQVAGITFASVHDCFWTHPASVDIMNKICRDCFVSLHSLDILGNLSRQFIHNYDNDKISEHLRILTNIPKLGSFDLKTVKDSVYFFA